MTMLAFHSLILVFSLPHREEVYEALLELAVEQLKHDREGRDREGRDREGRDREGRDRGQAAHTPTPSAAGPRQPFTPATLLRGVTVSSGSGASD